MMYARPVSYFHAQEYRPQHFFGPVVTYWSTYLCDLVFKTVLPHFSLHESANILANFAPDALHPSIFFS